MPKPISPMLRMATVASELAIFDTCQLSVAEDGESILVQSYEDKLQYGKLAEVVGVLIIRASEPSVFCPLVGYSTSHLCDFWLNG